MTMFFLFSFLIVRCSVIRCLFERKKKLEKVIKEMEKHHTHTHTHTLIHSQLPTLELMKNLLHFIIYVLIPFLTEH